MMNFKDFITEEEEGTYICADLSRESANKLLKWAKENGITDTIDAADMHTTITYSRKKVDEAKEYMDSVKFPISAKPKHFSIFPMQNGKKCLVLEVESKELNKHHKTIQKEYGATYDYPTYKPHITLTYDYTGDDVPKDIPDISLSYNSYKMEGINVGKFT